MKTFISMALSLAFTFTAGMGNVCHAAGGYEGGRGVAKAYHSYAEIEDDISCIGRGLLQGEISREEAFHRAREIARLLYRDHEGNAKKAAVILSRMRSLPLEQHELRSRYQRQYAAFSSKVARDRILMDKCKAIMDMCRM